MIAFNTTNSAVNDYIPALNTYRYICNLTKVYCHAHENIYIHTYTKMRDKT